jgi:hypothetical protein
LHAVEATTACELGGDNGDQPTWSSAPPAAMSFQSILYRRVFPNVPIEKAETPKFFKDLNFDQIVRR